MGDDYEQHDSDDSASYASRALRRFTARAAASGQHHDGTSRLPHDCTDWLSSHHQIGGATDTSHPLYQASATTGLHDDTAFVGKRQPMISRFVK